MPPVRQSYVVLISTLATAPLVILLALSFVLVPDEDATWGPWPAIVVALGVAGLVLAEVVGYRVEPPAAGTPPEEAATQARQRWQASALTRFAVTEAAFIVTVALLFSVSVPQPALLGAVAAVIAVVGILFHTWPWSRPVGKVADALERDGGRTRLREDLGAVTTR